MDIYIHYRKQRTAPKKKIIDLHNIDEAATNRLLTHFDFIFNDEDYLIREYKKIIDVLVLAYNNKYVIPRQYIWHDGIFYNFNRFWTSYLTTHKILPVAIDPKQIIPVELIKKWFTRLEKYKKKLSGLLLKDYHPAYHDMIKNIKQLDEVINPI